MTFPKKQKWVNSEKIMIKNWTLNVKNKTINTAKNSLNLSIENIQSFLNLTPKFFKEK